MTSSLAELRASLETRNKQQNTASKTGDNTPSINRDALQLWHSVLYSTIREGAVDLTARQMAILLHIYLNNAQQTVSSLAITFAIPKASVSRALTTLSKLGYIRRKRDESDKRIQHIQRTIKGSVFLSDYSTAIRNATNAVRRSKT